MCLYLQKRSNGVYYFRRIIPAVLHGVVGKEHWTFSLQTKDRGEAKRLRSHHAVETDRIIAEAQRALADLRQAQAEQGSETKTDWLSEFAQEEAAFAARKAAERQERRLARRHYRDDWRERLHQSTDRLPPRYAAIRDIIREQEERAAAAEARLRAVEGQAVQSGVTNAAAAPTRSTAPRWLDTDVVDGWAAESRPRKKGEDAHRAVARWFYERVGRKPVELLTKDDVLAFKTKLIAEGQTPANIKQKLSRLRTLLQWGADNGLAAANVAHGITMKVTQAAKNKRKPFDLAALSAIFSSPVYAEGQRPTQGRGEAAYWLPLLALFTGARMEELGQLRPGDVVELSYPDLENRMQKGWFIRLVEAEGEDETQLKTAESERLIPLHPELENRGFVTFAKASAANGEARLFPKLTPGPYGNLTHKWGQWFGSYLRGVCGVTDKRMTFHSFRHTFTDYVRRPDIPEGIQRQLVGHSSKDVHDEYGAGYNQYWLTQAMLLYCVPGLSIVDDANVRSAA